MVIAKYYKGAWSHKRNYALKQYGNRFPGSGRLGVDALCAYVALMASDKQCRFDVVNCHSASYAASRVYMANKMGLINLPIIITPHGQDIQVVAELNYGLRLDKTWDAIIKRNIKASDKVTAISNTIKNQLHFIPEHKIHKIPNGIHLRDFNAKHNSTLHQQLSISSKNKIVLSVGRHREVKGYVFGIRAFAELLKHEGTETLKYVIVGKDTQSLHPLVEELGIETSVFLLPQMGYQQVISAYQSAWCFLSPSLSEGLSLVSIEAMAGGLPLLVTNVPGNVDVVQENDCGLIVPPKDPQAIAQGLLSMHNNPELHLQFASKSKAGVRQYDWSNIAKQYIRVYRQSIEQRQQGSV